MGTSPREEERRVLGLLATDLDRGFEDLYLFASADVYSLLRRLSSTSFDAEEFVAETFLRAYAALRGYSPERRRSLKLRAWLAAIALNCFRNDLRARSRRVKTAALDGAREAVDPRARTEDEALDASSGALPGLLAMLCQIEREAVVLRHVLDLSVTEVALALGVPEGTAKSHVARGLAHLRAAFDSSGDPRNDGALQGEER